MITCKRNYPEEDPNVCEWYGLLTYNKVHTPTFCQLILTCFNFYFIAFLILLNILLLLIMLVAALSNENKSLVLYDKYRYNDYFKSKLNK